VLCGAAQLEALLTMSTVWQVLVLADAAPAPSDTAICVEARAQLAALRQLSTSKKAVGSGSKAKARGASSADSTVEASEAA
jgi:hypothetical protein